MCFPGSSFPSSHCSVIRKPSCSLSITLSVKYAVLYSACSQQPLAVELPRPPLPQKETPWLPGFSMSLLDSMALKTFLSVSSKPISLSQFGRLCNLQFTLWGYMCSELTGPSHSAIQTEVCGFLIFQTHSSYTETGVLDPTQTPEVPRVRPRHSSL
jgi:hypothetical protein